MPGFILTVAGWFGISAIRLIIYGAIAAAIVVGALTIRQHYVNLGYAKAITAVKKQDDRAVAAADRVQQKANDCAANSWWDVVSQGCLLEETK